LATTIYRENKGMLHSDGLMVKRNDANGEVVKKQFNITGFLNKDFQWLTTQLHNEFRSEG